MGEVEAGSTKGRCPGWKNRKRQKGSQPAQWPGSPLHVEHMGRVPGVPVLEVVGMGSAVARTVFPWFLQVLLIRSCINSVLGRWAACRKEMDWPVPDFGCQSSMSSISHYLLSSCPFCHRALVSEWGCPEGQVYC